MNLSKQFHRNICAGFSIRKCVMVIDEIIPAGSGGSLKLMILQFGLETSGSSKSIIECVIGIVHLIHLEHFLEASFVKLAVMGNKRKAFNHRCDFFPDPREDRSAVRIFCAEAMHLAAEPLVVFRFGMYQTVK